MKDNSTSPRRDLLGRPRRLFNTLAATGLAVSMATIGTNITSAAPAQASQRRSPVLVDVCPPSEGQGLRKGLSQRSKSTW